MPVEVPEDLLPSFSQLELEAYIDLELGRFAEAERKYRRQLVMILDRQRLDKRRYHKGGPLHNLGISLLKQQKNEEGLRNLLSAFVEDLYSVGWEKARGAPAFRVLTRIGLPQDQLAAFADTVQSFVGEVGVPSEPDVVLTTRDGETLVLELKGFRDLKPYLVARLSAKLAGNRDERVFIGGSYKNIVLLRQIADIVRELGFVPILVADYPEPITDEESHDASMELLGQCRYAIFEVSVPNGHMMELERCHQLVESGRIETLMVWQVRSHTKEDERPVPSRMLLAGKFEKATYANLSELVTIIAKFLGR